MPCGVAGVFDFCAMAALELTIEGVFDFAAAEVAVVLCLGAILI